MALLSYTEFEYCINRFLYIDKMSIYRDDMIKLGFLKIGDVVQAIESLSMTFTADGKRQRLPLTFYSFVVIIK